MSSPDMRDDELVWMRHSDHGGYAQLPKAAVPAWEGRGWERSEEPDEHNPVTAERTAWLAEQAATRELEAEQAKAAKPAKKTAAKSTTKSAASGDESKE